MKETRFAEYITRNDTHKAAIDSTRGEPAPKVHASAVAGVAPNMEKTDITATLRQEPRQCTMQENHTFHAAQ